MTNLDTRVHRAFDRHVAAGESVHSGWIPVDVYRLDGPDSCAVELARDGVRSRLRIRIARRNGGPAFERVGDLALAYELFGAHSDAERADADAGAARATAAAAEILRAPDREDVPPATARPAYVPRPIVDRHPAVRSELDAIGRLRARIASYLRGPVVVRDVPGGCSIQLPPIPPRRDTGPSFYFRVPGALRRRRVIREAFDALGYAIHEDGLVRTVPTPHTYRARRDAAGLTACGFEPQLESMTRIRVPLERWLRAYIDGVIEINVASDLFNDLSAVAFALGRPARFWCEHLTAIAHDMGTHVLPTSRVPRDRIDALGQRMAAAHDRATGRRNPLARRAAVSELVLFYEEDIVRHCTALWHRVATPDEVGELFCRDECWRGVLALLDARIARAGVAG